MRTGEWVSAGGAHRLKLLCGVSLVVWQGDSGTYRYSSSGFGALDKPETDTGTPDVREAKKRALRGVVHQMALAVDEATAVLVATGTGMV